MSRATGITAIVLFTTVDAYAIPSPDLVINLSASIAQLLGLVSVLFGGVALSSKKPQGKSGRQKSSKTVRILLTVSLSLFAVSLVSNLLQYTSTVDAKNTRLHTNLVRKSVENGKAVGNTSLKTLSFSDQKTHKLGISTETLSEWLASNAPINIIDVRENAEVEGGMISGATHVRYPDLLANPDLISNSGSNNLLLCYSGNRSSELCEALAAQGKSCNFMVGGYEKWLTESRPINAENETGSPNDLRNIPKYTNKEVLLDTPEVRELVDTEKAEFLDVRYPGDFELGHLPSAHNITMRALSTTELQRKLEQLPKVPLIAACYDKRSCFYSELIGLSLDRMGHDFRGRYTVPHEFYLPKGERAHVANWRAANEQATIVSLATKPLNGLLNWFTDVSGYFALGILMLVLSARLSLLPLTIKSERDQIVLKSLKPTMDKLKVDYAEHPRALSTATLKIYRENNIKPVFNIIASFAQLGFLLLFYSVVNNSSKDWTGSFLWVESAASIDPMYVLPAVVTGLFMYIIYQQMAPLSRKKSLLLTVGAVAFFALIQNLNAAINTYLTFSMVILVAQGFFIKALSKHFNWAGDQKRAKKLPVDDGIIPLSIAHLVPGTGKKGARLGELIASGYNVPDGFVLTDVVTHKLQSHDVTTMGDAPEFLDSTQSKKLEKLWSKLKAKRVAVRSSGLTEDGADTSFAGVYDSILNITKPNLLNAVAKVNLSLSSGVAEAYNSGVNKTNDDSAALSTLGGVVIQKMVPAEYAGVMFTEHPTNAGATLIEVVEGLGEDLVSGTVTPESYSYGRVTGTALDEQDCPIDLQELLSLGRQLEEQFGHPQDIEWAFAEGQFYLLQTRDITRSICDRDSTIGHSEAERNRLLKMVKLAGEDIVYAQNELSELLPTPTPLSASFMQGLWSAGGSTDLACQQLNIPYAVNFESDNIVTTVFGHTYINKYEEKLRLGKGPGAMAAFNLARNADQIEQHFRTAVLPDLLQSAETNHALDYSKLTLSQMLNTLDTRLNQFVSETYVEAEIVNIAADYYWKTADSKLTGDGQDSAQYLNYVPQTQVSKLMSLVTSGNTNKANIEKFIRDFGHRAPYDYELSQPRYCEDPALVINLIKGAGHKHPHQTCPDMPDNKLLRISIDRVHRFQALKEDAKHFCMLELNEIRRLLLAIDSHCEFNGDIFQLTIKEVSALNTASGMKNAIRHISDRKRQSESWKSISPPTTLTIFDLESMDVSTGKVSGSNMNGDLIGKHVAGDSVVKGVVRVIDSLDQISDFQEGEILVARMTDPQWYPLFPKARGIITEVGGWLSHAAIVAREYNLPAVVGISGACATLNTGDIVQINIDGSIDRLSEQRSPDSPLRAKPSSDERVSESELSDSDVTAAIVNMPNFIERRKTNTPQSRERRLERRKNSRGVQSSAI